MFSSFNVFLSIGILEQIVALRLNKEQLYDVVPAVYPSDIRDYYDPERKQVFVFDDICGKYSIHVQTMYDWKDLSDCIQKIIDGILYNLGFIFSQVFHCNSTPFTDCQDINRGQEIA
jgi:hypothetical protein